MRCCGSTKRAPRSGTERTSCGRGVSNVHVKGSSSDSPCGLSSVGWSVTVNGVAGGSVESGVKTSVCVPSQRSDPVSAGSVVRTPSGGTGASPSGTMGRLKVTVMGWRASIDCSVPLGVALRMRSGPSSVGT